MPWGWWEEGFAVGRRGEFRGLDVEVDPLEEEAVGVELGSVAFTPVVDEGGGEVARGGVGEGEDGGLHIPEFLDVGLEEGYGLIG